MAKSDGLGPNQRKWLKALESEKFKQTTGTLKTIYGGYCCLGVACEIFKTSETSVDKVGKRFVFDEHEGTAPPYVKDTLALRDDEGGAVDGKSLVQLNDGGKTFPAIAKIIRANPSNYFRSAK